MKILPDHGVPEDSVAFLAPHQVSMAKQQGWNALVNGKLLRATEQSGFELLITNDKNMRYQQNLRGMQIAVIVLSNCRWSILRDHLGMVADAIPNAKPGEFLLVEIPYPPRQPR